MTKQDSISYSNDTEAPAPKRRSALDDVIADSLIKIRENSGLLQKELAEMVGVKPQMISRYEKKESIVPFNIAYEIAAKLGVKLEDFFSIDQNNASQYGLSDNEQKILADYPANSLRAEQDIEKLKALYTSIKTPEKRQEFMNLMENVIKTYQD
jgi:transcriptional regulator with XRE-family HTH domain